MRSQSFIYEGEKGTMLKRSMINKNGVINLVVLLTIILNVYGAALSRMYNLPTIVFTAIPLVLLFMCLCIFNKGLLQVDSNIKGLLYINLFVFICHMLLCGVGSNEIKYFLYFIVFLVVNSLVSKQNWKIVEIALVGIGVFLSLDALQYLPDLISRGVRIYNVANSTILDKSVYTLVLTLAFICLLVNCLDKNLIKTARIVSLVLMVFFGAINIVLIQSKLFILVLTATIFVLYFFTNDTPKKFVRSFSLVAVLLIVVAFVFYPQIIPDYIYVFLNRYLGVFGDAVSSITAYDRYTTTYSMRGTVYDFAFDLFLNHPLFGVGFGNYKIYAIENAGLLGGVTQTESSMMNVLVEGGAIYFVTHLALLLLLLQRIIRVKKKDSENLLYTKLLVILIAYVILNTGNDFYNVLYWVILGYIYKLTKESKVINI